MGKKYFLMNWPNPDFQEGFYVEHEERNVYVIGHITNRKKEKFFQNHTHVISKEIYNLLKKQSIENKKRITHAYESIPSHEEVVAKILKL